MTHEATNETRRAGPSCSGSMVLDLSGIVDDIAAEIADGHAMLLGQADRVLARLAPLLETVARLEEAVETLGNAFLANQKCLQAFERAFRERDEQSFRNRVLAPLSRKLLRFKKDLQMHVELPSELACLPDTLDEILADFGIEVIKPDKGEPFDPAIMKPVNHLLTGNIATMVVANTVDSGARLDGYVLQPARVKLTLRASVPVESDQPCVRSETPDRRVRAYEKQTHEERAAVALSISSNRQKYA